MSSFDRDRGTRKDEALEQLLRHASPRPMPSESDEAIVREAVRAEWQAVSGAQKTRLRVAGLAIAATVIFGVFAALTLLRPAGTEFVQVASIEKSFGSIYLLAETSELRKTVDLSSIYAGQTIVTGEDAGMALAWGTGGSLRMDSGSRVRFLDDDSVFLEAGRVYFDSMPSKFMPSALTASPGAVEASNFVVVTDFGEVVHVGTQFMTRVDDGKLIVSVREGEVRVDNRYREYAASSGEQITLAGSAQPVILSISGSGGDWSWVSRTSPVTEVDGRSLHEFLLWACRETGLEYHYEGGAEQIARHEAFLKGAIYTEPLQALKLRLETAGLEWAIVDGAIYVSDKAINVRDK